jgi:ubiquinone biosynthesis protein
MLSFLRSLRYLPKYRRIVAALTRHGLGWLADQLGLSRFLRWPQRLFRREPPSLPISSLAQHLCQAFAELGSSFVLLGHYLSTRPDLVPRSLCQELDCLPRSGPVLPAAEVTQIVEQELGQPLACLFAEFSPQPWRSTWLEQVHLARTPDGQEVWVYVPNTTVQAQLEADQPLFEDLARQVDEHRPLGWRGSAALLRQDWRETVRQETDGSERGHNVERWQRNSSGREDLLFPEVDWTRTTAQVLTCRAFTGRPLGEFAADGAGTHEDLARALYRFFGQALFLDGFYPAPPALDGLLVLADGRLALVALAPAGALDESTRQALWHLFEHLRGEDLAGILDACVSLGLFGRHEVSAAACQAVRHIVERYQGLPMEELRLNELAGELFAMANRGILAIPGEISLLLRTLAAVENLGRWLAPRIPAAAELAPAVQQAMAAQHSWQVRGERIVRAGQAGLEALRSFPVEATRLLSQAVQGDLTLGVEPRSWQKPMRRLERMVYRLVLCLIAAGLLIGLSLLVTALLPTSGGPWGWILVGGAVASLVGLSFLLFLAFLKREG